MIQEHSTPIWLAWIGVFVVLEVLTIIRSRQARRVGWSTLSAWLWWVMDTRPWFRWFLALFLMWLAAHLLSRGHEFDWLLWLARRW